MLMTFSPFILALLLSKSAFAITGPFGYGARTTGGGSARAAIPSSNEELVSWLGDATPRVILLDKVYDFTGSEGSVTGKGCKPWTCSGMPQAAIDYDGWCEKHEPTAERTSVTYDKTGTTAILVASNKTLLGKGKNAAIKGKGLRIANSRNVIVQNIRISDINAALVWGGDAITIERVENVWIDHNYFKDIGRQFIVTVHSVKSITISNNIFDGSSTYSATCNGRHYWALLFSGADSITLARNHLYKTSGRGPRLDGTGGLQSVHIYNNHFDDIEGHALDADGNSDALVEGNYFEKVTEPSNPDTKGSIFAPDDATTTAQCSSYIGRKCVPNSLFMSGKLGHQEIKGVSSFKGVSAVMEAAVMETSQVKNYVKTHAGTGKLE